MLVVFSSLFLKGSWILFKLLPCVNLHYFFPQGTWFSFLGCPNYCTKSCSWRGAFDSMADDISSKIYVGSLSYNTNNEGLREFFEKVGPVTNGKYLLQSSRSY